MNQAITQRSAPKQQPLIANIGEIAQALGHVPSVNTAAIAAEIVRFAQDGAKALDQAERAVIETQEAAGKAADLLKAIRATLNSQDAARKRYTGPLDDFKAKLMRLYAVGAGNLEAASDLLKQKAKVFLVREQDALRVEANAARLRQEEEALRLAAAQAALGDAAGAEQILAEASTRETEVVKATSTGAYGATLGGRVTKRGSVTDNTLFLQDVVSSTHPACVKFIADLRFPQSALNDLARAVLETKASDVPLKIEGFKADEVTDISVR